MWKIFAVAVLATVLVLPAQPASALENEDLLALVAMPLAVAAVSEITDVPMNQLMDVVTLLNDAAVPPPQFIEVVRYVPVALIVENDEPDFVEFVRLRRGEGLVGTALVTSIEDRMRFYDIGDVNLRVTRPRVVDVTEDFIPVIVRTRLVEARKHPHGGPPGQLKKAAGVKTGAEIVHGSKPGRSDDRIVVRDRDDNDRRVTREGKAKKHAAKGGKGKSQGDRGGGKGKDKGKGKG
ncbi:MAG TPA: hypothetical protein VEK57_30325 [Thermoanaerobaculia bacterium]|nr:hypothetical protein [Thermoanaerobaculia bacterium]